MTRMLTRLELPVMPMCELLADQSLPPTVAFDAGPRPRPLPDEAANLLPGLLAATRTGLPPAGDDELTTTDQLHTTTSILLGARMIKVGGAIACKGRGAVDLAHPGCHGR